MRARFSLFNLALSAATLLVWTSYAAADAGTQKATTGAESTKATTGVGGFDIWAKERDDAHNEDGANQPRPISHSAGHWVSAQVCGLGGRSTCSSPLLCADGQPMVHTWFQEPSGARHDESDWCPDKPRRLGRLPAAAQIEDAFRRLPLPASPLHIQPGGGKTRVNFDTIFYTTNSPFARTIQLLGHRVVFHVTPTTYTWNWGDGHTDQTGWPGQPYEQAVPISDDITHRYESDATFRPRLDTTYSATYAVDGGPSRPVEGTVTIQGSPTSLKADTYTPVLVD